MKTIYYFLENITKKIYNRTLLSNNVTFLKQCKIWKGREREENWWLQFLQAQYLDEECYPFIFECAHLQHKWYNSPNDALLFIYAKCVYFSNHILQ